MFWRQRARMREIAAFGAAAADTGDSLEDRGTLRSPGREFGLRRETSRSKLFAWTESRRQTYQCFAVKVLAGQTTHRRSRSRLLREHDEGLSSTTIVLLRYYVEAGVSSRPM